MGWYELARAANDAAAAAFGDAAVTYEPDGGAPYELPEAVYRRAYEELDLAGMVAVSSEQPVLGVREGDLNAPPTPRDHVTVAPPYESPAKRWRVREKMPGGEGWLVLILIDT